MNEYFEQVDHYKEVSKGCDPRLKWAKVEFGSLPVGSVFRMRGGLFIKCEDAVRNACGYNCVWLTGGYRPGEDFAGMLAFVGGRCEVEVSSWTIERRMV